ncbi:hypothetical protein GCM10009713_20010 [Brevibacterium celere]
MRDGAAEGGETEAQEDAEDLAHRARVPRDRCAHPLSSFIDSRTDRRVRAAPAAQSTA